MTADLKRNSSSRTQIYQYAPPPPPHTHAIDLFINRDAILNRDALWSIQGKNHYLQAAIVGGIHYTGKILR